MNSKWINRVVALIFEMAFPSVLWPLAARSPIVGSPDDTAALTWYLSSILSGIVAVVTGRGYLYQGKNVWTTVLAFMAWVSVPTFVGLVAAAFIFGYIRVPARVGF